MFEEKVSLEQATKEVNDWLDFKKVSPRKRESFKEMIESIVDGIQYGQVTIEDNKIVQLLKFPLQNESGGFILDKIEYAPRLSSFQLKKYSANIKAGDGNARVMATAAALCDKGVSILEKLDTEDLVILQAVAVFFL